MNSISPNDASDARSSRREPAGNYIETPTPKYAVAGSDGAYMALHYVRVIFEADDAMSMHPPVQKGQEKEPNIMKTNLIKFTLAVIFASAMALPAMASDSATGTGTDSPAQAFADARFSSDKPEVKVLFQHTSAKPYDIKCLTWYGGVMERIVVENASGTTVTVHFQLTGLRNGIVAAPANHTKITKVCGPGETVTLMDLLSKDGDTALAYNFKLDNVTSTPVTTGRMNSGTRFSMSNIRSLRARSLAAF